MNGRTIGNLILMTTICVVIFWIFMGIKGARAQPFMGDPYDGARAAQWWHAPPNVYRAWGYAALPPAMWTAPPPIAPPPPYPIGWVWRTLAPCADPDCRTVVVSVGVDGANVRATPGGPVTSALANGVPLVPLDKAGPWMLVAPACALAPTWTWSVTAGVPLSVCGL